MEAGGGASGRGSIRTAAIACVGRSTGMSSGGGGGGATGGGGAAAGGGGGGAAAEGGGGGGTAGGGGGATAGDGGTVTKAGSSGSTGGAGGGGGGGGGGASRTTASGLSCSTRSARPGVHGQAQLAVHLRAGLGQPTVGAGQLDVAQQAREALALDAERVLVVPAGAAEVGGGAAEVGVLEAVAVAERRGQAEADRRAVPDRVGHVPLAQHAAQPLRLAGRDVERRAGSPART